MKLFPSNISFPNINMMPIIKLTMIITLKTIMMTQHCFRVAILYWIAHQVCRTNSMATQYQLAAHSIPDNVVCPNLKNIQIFHIQYAGVDLPKAAPLSQTIFYDRTETGIS